MWRNEAYKQGGTPLPWEPEELLRKEYERGYADAMGWKLQNHLEHLPVIDKSAAVRIATGLGWEPKREWVGLTDEEIDKAWRSCDYTVPWEQHRIDLAKAIEAKLKEKNQ
jgi:hypothetical protein